jgi:hypothetical protein
MNSTSATAAVPHEIKIDETNRVLDSPASSDGCTFYVTLIIGLLAATCGLPWFIGNESALPFNLTSVGGLTANPKAVSSSLEQTSNSPSARMPETRVRDMIVHEIAQRAPSAVPQSPKISSATAPPSRPESKDSAVGPQHTTLTAARAEELRVQRKLTPTPETRPTTIKGWTLREVTNGTAVLEGPNGVWKATPGQTVPGVGRVDSIVRWGNRLIVATSGGLISTP